MPFARAVVDLIEEMKASSRGQPELGDAVPSSYDHFGHGMEKWPWIVGICRVRPGVHGIYGDQNGLNIPPEFRPLIPKKI